MNLEAKRCPQCHIQPEVRVEANHEIILICAQHGHMAIGGDLDTATYHWNMYVTFLGQAA
jgi:hypothetical protein